MLLRDGVLSSFTFATQVRYDTKLLRRNIFQLVDTRRGACNMIMAGKHGLVMKANQCFSLSGFDFKGGFCDNATGLVGIQIDSIMAASNMVGGCLFSLFPLQFELCIRF